MKYLLVDNIKPNNQMALTSNFDKFIYNLQQFGGSYYKDFQYKLENSDSGEYIDILSFGRFICIIQQAKDKKKSGMILMDVANDDDIAYATSRILFKKESANDLQHLYLEVFYKLKPNYQKVYYDIELTLDSSLLN